MKTINNLTYVQVVLLGLLSEAVLMAIQFIYLYASSDPDGSVEFTSDYMRSTGFYIFQVIGLFFYSVVIYFVVRGTATKIFSKVGTLLIAGAIYELAFYLVIVADYEGAFFYSILDKIIASAFAMILLSYTSRQGKKPESYL